MDFIEEGIDQFMGTVASAAGLVFVLFLGILIYLAFQAFTGPGNGGNQARVGPWGEPPDFPTYGEYGGIRIGQELPWN